jgi:hypothetical protein
MASSQILRGQRKLRATIPMDYIVMDATMAFSLPSDRPVAGRVQLWRCAVRRVE